MHRLAIMSVALVLSACSSTTSKKPIPNIPVLPDDLKDKCPPLQQLKDKSIGTLAVGDLDAVTAYQKCQAKYNSLVLFYDKVRNEIIAFYTAQTKK